MVNLKDTGNFFKWESKQHAHHYRYLYNIKYPRFVSVRTMKNWCFRFKGYISSSKQKQRNKTWCLILAYGYEVLFLIKKRLTEVHFKRETGYTRGLYEIFCWVTITINITIAITPSPFPNIFTTQLRNITKGCQYLPVSYQLGKTGSL